MRLFLFLGIVLGVQAQEPPSANPSSSLDPSGTPSLAPSDEPSVSQDPSGTPSLVPSNEPSLSHEPSLSAAPSQMPTLSQLPSTIPSFEPSQDPSTSHSPSASFEPSSQPSTISEHKGIEIQLEMETPLQPPAEGHLPAIDARIWAGPCQVFNYKDRNSAVEQIKFVLLDGEKQERDNFLNKPTEQLNGKHTVTIMLDVQKENIMQSEYFKLSDENNDIGVMHFCFRSYLAVDYMHENNGEGVIDQDGWEVVDFHEDEIILTVDLVKEINPFSSVTTKTADSDKVPQFNGNLETNPGNPVAAVCDLTGNNAKPTKVTPGQLLRFCLKISDEDVGIRDIMEVTLEGNVGVYSPILNFMTNSFSSKKSLDETLNKKWQAEVNIPAPFFESSNTGVQITGAYVMKYQDDSELLRQASTPSRRTLDSSNTRMLQETNSGQKPGTFSLYIELAPINADTPQDASPQTKPSEINVEEESSTAAFSVSSLALLVVVITIVNIFL